MEHQLADLVLRNGTILSFDSKNSRHEAIAICGDRIAMTCDDAAVESIIGPDTRVFDLNGQTVVPGFNDTHAHMEREGLKRIRPSLAGARSVAEILRRITAAVAQVPAGDWIVTMPIGDPPYFFGGPDILDEKRMPTREELDRVAPHHPVCIPGLFGNWGVPPGYTALNTHALRLNGIGPATSPRCRGVEILKDSSGNPTGIIIEHNYRPTVEFDLLQAVPRFSEQERRRGAAEAMRLYNTVGITSAYEGHGSAPEIISVYRSLWERNEMSVRVGLVVSPTWENVAEATAAMRDYLSYARGTGLGDHWLRISGVHIAYGGDATTAALARAELPNTGWAGFVEQANSRYDFREYCMLAAQYDLRLHTIVGDNLHEVIPILAEVAERYPIGQRRWVIEHIGRARPEDLRLLKSLGLFVTTIPVYYLWKGGRQYLDDADDGNLVVPHRHLLDLGVPLASGTDNIPYDPLFTLWSICTRHERTSGRVLGPEQRLAMEPAMRLLTIAGAWLTFEEDIKGPLCPGNLADLAVLSDNPLDIDPENIRKLKCRMTIVGGRIVFDNISNAKVAHAKT